jgi:alpha-tubulin suppressor-like RCC1 family protein
MGDDTFGQCGTGGEGRSMTAPFFESRHRKPVKVLIEQKVKKIVAGFRHSLAITEDGKLYGWGYNN